MCEHDAHLNAVNGKVGCALAGHGDLRMRRDRPSEASSSAVYDAPLSRSFSAFAGVNLAALDAAIWIAAPV